MFLAFIAFISGLSIGPLLFLYLRYQFYKRYQRRDYR